MFKVTINKWLHSCMATAAGGDRVVRRHYELPFAPYPGLKILDGDFECELKDVYWEADKGVFRAYDEPDRTYYEVGRQKDFMWQASEKQMDKLVKEYVDAGWIEDKKTATLKE